MARPIPLIPSATKIMLFFLFFLLSGQNAVLYSSSSTPAFLKKGEKKVALNQSKEYKVKKNKRRKRKKRIKARPTPGSMIGFVFSFAGLLALAIVFLVIALIIGGSSFWFFLFLSLGIISLLFLGYHILRSILNQKRDKS